MSFLAGLLARELGTTATAAPAPVPGTTPDGAVVPRLASRFEEPGAPRWPGTAGDAAPGLGEVPESGAGDTAWERPAGPARNTTGPLPATVRPAAGTAPAGESGPDARMAGRPATGLPGRPEMPADPAPNHGMTRPGSVRPGNTVRPSTPAPAHPRPVFPMDPTAGRGAPPTGRAPAGPGTADAGTGHPAGNAVVAPSATGTAVAPWQRLREPADAHQPGNAAVRPRLDPLPRPEPMRPAPAHIHVSIGRIEVRAVTAPPARQAEPREPTGLMGLDEYLRGRP